MIKIQFVSQNSLDTKKYFIKRKFLSSGTSLFILLLLIFSCGKKQIIKTVAKTEPVINSNYKPSLLLRHSKNTGSIKYQEFSTAMDDYLLSLFTLQSKIFIRLDRERKKAITQIWGKKNYLSFNEEKKVAKFLGIDASLILSYKVSGNSITLSPKIILNYEGEVVNLAPLTGELSEVGSLIKKQVKNILSAFGKNELKRFPSLHGTVDNSKLWDAIPSPNYAAFKSYSEGLFIGDGKVPRAKNILKDARRKDRSFFLPLYKRYGLTYLYKSQRPIIIRKLDKYQKFHTKIKNRLLYWALMWHRLAKIALLEGDYINTDKCLNREFRILKEADYLNSIYYIHHLILKSYRYYSAKQLELSLGFAKTAQDLARFLSYWKGSIAVNLYILNGNIYAGRGQNDMALWNYNNDNSLLNNFDLSSSLIKSLLEYNIATIQLRKGLYDISLAYFQNAKKSLREKGYINSHLYLSLILNESYIYLQKEKYKAALKIYKEIELSAKMLGPELRLIYAHSLYNKGLILKKEHKSLEAKRSIYKAARIYRSLKLASLAEKAVKQFLGARNSDIQSVYSLPEINAAGLTLAEARQIKSYTGAFNLERHTPRIRARTYVGRQYDTVVFLDDLLHPSKTEDKALHKLRKLFIGNNFNSQGKGLVFIDIGPALANLEHPAVTAFTIAKKFNELKVVGMDLPREVKRFLKYVPEKNRMPLINKPNFYILSGDGLAPLKKQLNNSENWIPKDKVLPPIKDGMPIIIRAANSIDIYFPWGYIKNTLKNMTQDFIANPLLLFFNRSIMYKPKGSDKFRVVGYVSIRGFHHNRQSYDRGGEKAYTLLEEVLK